MSNKKRRTSQSVIGQAIQELNENLPSNEPICDPCTSKLKKGYASIQSGRRQTASTNIANADSIVVNKNNAMANERRRRKISQFKKMV